MTRSASPSVVELDPSTWSDANHAYLDEALAEVAESIARHLGRPSATSGRPVRRRGSTRDLEPPAALDLVCSAFGLSPFERSILVCCAGVELDAAFAELCAEASGERRPAAPTFALALAALPDPHWSAIGPDSPLRRWRLVELHGHGSLTQDALRIDEHVLHYLAGTAGHDPKLAGVVDFAGTTTVITGGQESAAHQLVDRWQRSSAEALPVVAGVDRSTRIAIAGHAARDLGHELALIDPAVIPVEPAAREALARLLERESALGAATYVVDGDDDTGWAGVDALIAITHAPMAVSATQPPPLRRRPTLVIDAPRPTAREQRELWGEVLADDPAGEALAAAFDLGAEAIRVAAAVGEADAAWAACRALDRPELGALAQRVDSAASWSDLVLPAAQRRTLELLVAHARHRVTVYDDWGMRMGRSLGLGSTAVFSGPSGTGKTFAAEVIAADLGLDLYRVDLSAVVSKYVGETEKNLRRVFDAADHGSAVLLFDEADALFGKRTEVRDSHDRYANVEVSYLLQRMEAYRGTAILTTNMAESIDAAFLRRVRFVVHFPFPDKQMRLELWRRAFPAAAPADGLDLESLAGMDLAGGTIRNVAVNAAFVAADAAEPIQMQHVMQAARIESGKLGRPMPTLRAEPDR